MPSNVDNISIIVQLLKHNEIRKIVISPGGTNIALIRAVQDDSFFECYSVVDERSAAYFAIGLYLQSGEPIALCCTSAQATRNYIPGLTEAYYKRVPLLAITMQKHPRFTGQEYMQAPVQSSLPIDSVKKSYVMPFISDLNDEYYGIRVANEAMLELTRDGMGPVQLCVPWLDFPLSGDVPAIRKIERYSVTDVQNIDLNSKKVLLAIGEHRPFDAELHSLVERFCRQNDVVVYANLLSNFHSDLYTANNLLMSSLNESAFSKVAPDVLITMGGQTGDYPFYRMLSKPAFSDIEHWRIGENGEVIDTYDKLTRIYQCSEKEFFQSACSRDDGLHAPSSYVDIWREIDSSLSTDVEVPFSNLYIARKFATALKSSSTVQLSILNSLRTWSLFEFNSSISFYSNVGAFGIDGGMSTLVGQSFATDDLCFMVIGDLAFLYDINSLSIRGIRSNIRILLVNNNGGFEFKIDTGHDESVDRFIAAAGHFKTAKGWASDCGFEYLSASDAEQFKATFNHFIGASDKPIVFEVFVSDDDEYEAYRRVMEKNQILSLADSLKKELKKSLVHTLGQSAVRRLSHH